MDDVQTIEQAEALKAKLTATWQAGDFAEIAKSIEQGAEDFVSRLNLRPGVRVLDVACGNGNTAIPAAKAGADVTGVDIAGYLIAQAVERSRRECVIAKFEVGDAEDLPYESESFDSVITMFGAMFTPRPDVTISEIKRVCRAGGEIAMANWTPSGFVGQMFKTTGKHVPPPAALPSPVLWGDPDTVRQRLGQDFRNVEMTPRMIAFTFPFGPEAVVEHFRQFYGPTNKAFAALEPEKQELLRSDLEELWSANNTESNGTTIVYSEYLEVRAVRV